MEKFFLQQGIDVYLQISDPFRDGFFDITPKQLAELIQTSNSDFTVVIGDQNVKNKSCQLKKQSKLTEMQPVDVTSLIWKAWPQNRKKALERVENFNEAQVETLIFQYGGPDRIFDRMKKVINLSKLIKPEQKKEYELLRDLTQKLRLQIKNSYCKIQQIPIQVENPQTYCGNFKTIEYEPNAKRTPKNTIFVGLKNYLLNILEIMASRINYIAVFSKLNLPDIPAYPEIVNNLFSIFNNMEQVSEKKLVEFAFKYSSEPEKLKNPKIVIDSSR